MPERQKEPTVHTLDLNFMGIRGAIAVYLIPHSHGAALIECGPGSTIPALQAGLAKHGLDINDVTYVLLTHIHLDHAGAAGWLARQGARIHVHPVGAPHMLDPAKLLSSAGRIYGQMMDTLWGQFLPVPEEQLSIPLDGDVIEIDGLRLRALDTPGHAYHHYVYIFNDVCFSGDFGGVRLPGPPYLRLPMPPPEIHLEIWQESLQRLQAEFDQGAFHRIAPTHFGIYDDPAWHLAAIEKTLDDTEAWLLQVMPADPPIEQIQEQFVVWTRERALAAGVEAATIDAYETANPTWMSAYGLQRYWRKYREQQD